MSQKSAGEREQGNDLRDYVATLVALAVQDKKAGSVTGKIAAFTALLAAIGALVGSSQSLLVSQRTSETQEKIEERQVKLDARQKKIDERQELLDENMRIGNIYVSDKHKDETCGGIPTDETVRWNDYRQCVFRASNTQQFSQVTDEQRLPCLKQLRLCRLPTAGGEK